MPLRLIFGLAIPALCVSVCLALPPELALPAPMTTAALLAQAQAEYFAPSTVPGAAKSYPQAFFRSLILPGWGELYAGARGEAKVFFLAEGTIWAGVVGFRVQGKSLKDDYTVFAAAHAGAHVENKDDDYFKRLGQYSSSEEYNEAVRREARELYFGDPEQERAYIEAHAYGPSETWRWENVETWTGYRDLRVKSLNAYKRGEHLVGIALLNRLISAIEAVRQTRNFNRGLTNSEASWHLRIEPSLHARRSEISVALQKAF